MANNKSVEATDQFTPMGIDALQKAKKNSGKYPVLSFSKDGKKTDYKVTSIRKGRVYIRKINMVDPEHLRVVDSKESDK